MQAPEVTLTTPDRGPETTAAFGGESPSGPAPVHRHLELASFSQLIPAPLRESMARISGTLLCVFSILGAIALSTWTISDRSLTFAHGGTADNWLGFWGASFADLSQQFFGLASIALLAPPFLWGLFKLSGRRLIPFKIRLGFWVGSLILLAGALGCVSVPEGWPLKVGLGGVVGDAALSIPHTFIGAYPSGVFATILFLLFVVPGAWMLLRACNLSNGLPSKVSNPTQDRAVAATDFPEDEMVMPAEQTGRDWSGLIAAPLGLIIHLGYSFTSIFQRKRQQYTPVPSQGMAPSSIPAAPETDAETAGQHIVRPEPVAAPTASPAVPMPEGDHASVTMESGDIHDPAMPEPSMQEAGQVTGPETAQPLESEAGIETVERTRVAAPGMDTDETPVPHTDAAHSQPVIERAERRPPPRPVNGEFILPSLDLLSVPQGLEEDPSLSNEALEENARQLEGVLEDFGVKGQILKVRPGPVVTLYELEPAPGVKSSRVIGLAEDIARSMSAIAARVAVVPGRNAIGIELPNKRRETVYLREQFQSKEFKTTKAKLAMCLGKTIGGEAVVADLAKMPHLLVAGTTGSGKSVAINTMILSLLYRLGPDRCKLIMIDPKMLELSIYDGIPHLLTPVVVDPKKAVVALKWTVREMEDRYKKMSKVGVRNIDGFNARITEAKAKGEVITRTVQTGFDRHTGEAIYEHEELDLDILPFIVVIIDEMADLMMVAGKDIEGTVQRLAQMARAAGIHVIMATQRPSVDVITGTIKANFPTRISFQVTSKIDSRTILGEMGAEQLLGMGDMLYMAGGGRITRVHGPFVDDQEVEDIVNHLKAQGVPQYLEAVTEEDEEEEAATGGGGAAGAGSDSDDPYDQAVAIVLQDRKVSTSYIQRRLSIGYNRAATLIERMEQEGLISPANHAGKREILVPAEDETI